jgi:hypothetical protein
MSLRRLVPKVAFFLGVTSVPVASCGGRLAPLPGHGDGGGEDSGAMDARADAGADADGSLPDGAPTDERGPPPVPVCAGENAACIPPDAGIVWRGASVIKCQGEDYVGPWTLILERLIGPNYQVVQKAVVQEPGFGWTFTDMSAPPAELTYRVCVVLDSMTAECGPPLMTGGPSNCSCEPTNCDLMQACNVAIEDECGGKLQCGACSDGSPCDSNHTCCPPGFMPDGRGGCVCAPAPGCPLCAWETVDCSCYSCNAPLPL